MSVPPSTPRKEQGFRSSFKTPFANSELKRNLRGGESVGTLHLIDGFARAPIPTAPRQRAQVEESFCTARHPRRFAVEVQGAADSGAEIFPGVIEDRWHDVPLDLA